MKKIIVIFISLIIIVGTTFFFLFNKEEKISEYAYSTNIDYSNVKELDIDLYSRGYLLVRLNDFKALYGKRYDNIFYPASLTKVVALNTVLNRCSNLEDTSHIEQVQYDSLWDEGASLYGLTIDEEYSIKDLLYYLVLPSGADAGVALENYFEKNGSSLVEEMNMRCKELGIEGSHFTNPTGLHDDNLYTTLKDLAVIYIDTLKYDVGKDVLKTSFSSEYNLYSTLYKLANNRDDDITIFGGKTGFTPEAGQNIIFFYEVDNKSYMLMLYGADGNGLSGESLHFEDANKVLDYLYN